MHTAIQADVGIAYLQRPHRLGGEKPRATSVTDEDKLSPVAPLHINIEPRKPRLVDFYLLKPPEKKGKKHLCPVVRASFQNQQGRQKTLTHMDIEETPFPSGIGGLILSSQWTPEGLPLAIQSLVLTCPVRTQNSKVITFWVAMTNGIPKLDQKVRSGRFALGN